ncbi:MAG: histidine kinase dimerization/phospho-acceptor domain-containing protein [Chlamydiota bacterium]
MEQPTVLVLSADAEFARAVLARWQTERKVPAFAVVSSRVWNGAATAAFDLALVGPLEAATDPALQTLEQTGKPVICLCATSAAAHAVRQKMPRVLAFWQHEAWLETVVLLGGECLRRVETMKRAQQAEQAAALSRRQAALGRYMLEMRHGLNNALTSVLGNSELLLLEPGELSAPVREQIEIIRNMGLRMHEIIQRFSSLENEIRVAEERGSSAVPSEKAFAIARG